MKTKYILIFCKAMIEVLLSSLKEIEEHSDKDADGLPLDEEWSKQSYLLSSFRSIIKEFEDYEKGKSY